MNGRKNIALPLLAIAVLLAALPLLAQAQFTEPPPHIFIGTARVNGFPVAAGVPITAWVGARQAAETRAGGGGQFSLLVSAESGDSLSFRIGELTAEQSASWQLGTRDHGFILTASNAADPCFALPPGARALVEVEQPYHEITGKATVNGWPAPLGTPITAWQDFDDQPRQIGYTLAGAEGSFALQIIGIADLITFRIGKMGTRENLFSGRSGRGTFKIALTAKDGPCTGYGSGTEMEELLADKFIRAFTFDNAAKEWLFYDPAVGDASTLQTFIPGRAYFILVSENVGVSLNGNYQELSHIAGNGWNLIVW